MGALKFLNVSGGKGLELMAEAYLIDKLNSVEQTFQELTRRMADPDVAQDPDEFQRIAKTRSSLEETVITYHQWKEAVDELAGAKEVYKGAQGDPEMREMAALEVEELEQTIERLENRLKILLLPKDPNDEKSIMLEVRAGTGGDEASIWAGGSGPNVFPLRRRPGLAG